MNPPGASQPTPWLQAARKALDTWGPTPALPIAAAIRDAHAEGLKRGAELADRAAQPILATQLRRLAEEVGSSPVLPTRGTVRSAG